MTNEEKENRDAELWIKLEVLKAEIEDCTPLETTYLIEQLILINKKRIEALMGGVGPLPQSQMPLKFTPCKECGGLCTCTMEAIKRASGLHFEKPNPHTGEKIKREYLTPQESQVCFCRRNTRDGHCDCPKKG